MSYCFYPLTFLIVIWVLLNYFASFLTLLRYELIAVVSYECKIVTLDAL